MAFFIGVLTFIILVNSIVLVFLVLIQLPKKEAGAGVAFGGGATDALFGAGSGNVLTKATKYAAGLFFAVALILALVQSRYAHREGSDFRRQLDAAAANKAAALSAPTGQPTTGPLSAPAGQGSNASGFIPLGSNSITLPLTNAAPTGTNAAK